MLPSLAKVPAQALALSGGKGFVQAHCTIDLQKISDADIEVYIERLKEYQI
jgi:hypothetical protein